MVLYMKMKYIVDYHKKDVLLSMIQWNYTWLCHKNLNIEINLLTTLNNNIRKYLIK